MLEDRGKQIKLTGWIIRMIMVENADLFKPEVRKSRF